MPLPALVRRPSGVVPTTIAILALVVAGSGAAVAAAATKVNIFDATNTSNSAKVDAGGRLSVSAPVTTFNASTALFSSSVAYPITSPTTATLALTDLTYDNGYNRQFPNTDYALFLYRTQVGSSGNCYDSDAVSTLYRRDAVPAGTSFSHAFTTPLVFRPTGSKKYCINIRVATADANTPSTEYAVGISYAGYTISGTYTTPPAKTAVKGAPQVRHNR